jgi:hypothetical protein
MKPRKALRRRINIVMKKESEPAAQATGLKVAVKTEFMSDILYRIIAGQTD